MRSIPFLTICVLALDAASADTWYVDGAVSTPGDGTTWQSAFQTIQGGIDEASQGDTVIVAEGTYLENIHFDGKNITLTSTDPLDPSVVDNTIIDGSQRGSVVTFSGSENESCVLSGLTIRNGRALQGGGICGGTADQPTHATITHNVITGNSTAETESDDGPYGGGLAFCDGLIEKNSICENTALAWGGGLYACNGMIQNNTISANSADSGAGLSNCGGTIQHNVVSENIFTGLFLCHGTIQYNIVSENYGSGLCSCAGLIQGNTISLNWTIRGGGLCFCNGMIKNNIISENYGGECGGGLYMCNGTIRNNLIVGNSSVAPSPYESDYGGGLYACDGLIENNTITGNSSQHGDGLSWCRGTIRNCIIWPDNLHESSTPTYSCIQRWSGGGEGNIALDPQFVDPDGSDNDPHAFADNDYRLSAGSPCIDAGINEGWMWMGIDLDGNPRVWNGTGDMGAYEYGSWPFAITQVLMPPAGGYQLTWSSRPGDTYTIRSCADPSGDQWDLEETVVSTDAFTSWTDGDTTSPRKFYRIEVE